MRALGQTPVGPCPSEGRWLPSAQALAAELCVWEARLWVPRIKHQIHVSARLFPSRTEVIPGAIAGRFFTV